MDETQTQRGPLVVEHAAVKPVRVLAAFFAVNRDWTHAKLADAVGVTKSTIDKACTTNYQIGTKTVRALVKITGLDAESLLFGERRERWSIPVKSFAEYQAHKQGESNVETS